MTSLRTRSVCFEILASAALLLGTALALPASAQSTDQPSTQPATRPDPVDDQDRSPEAVEKALQLAEEVAEAYRQATNFTDHIDFIRTVPIGTLEQEIKLAFGTGTDARIEFNRMVFTSLGDRVYVEFAMDPGHYVDMPLEGDLAMTTSRGGAGLAIPHFALRRATNREDITRALTRIVGGGTIVGFLEVKGTEDGARSFEILTEGPDGEGTIRVDPETKFISHMHMEFTVATDILEVSFVLNPRVHKTLPAPIAFDARGREPLEHMHEFAQQIIDQGDEAPNLIYTTTSGEKVWLSGQEDDALLLVCWAESNEPDLTRYMEAIGTVEEFIRDHDLPIRVYAVNTLQYAKTDAEQDRFAPSFWKDKGYPQPLIVDHGDILGKLFAFSATPSTVIINRDHRIEKKFIGPDDRLDEKIIYVLREMFGLRDIEDAEEDR